MQFVFERIIKMPEQKSAPSVVNFAIYEILAQICITIETLLNTFAIRIISISINNKK